MVILINITSSYEYRVNNINGYGRQFDGVGAISGGGATSKLLTTYPEKQRSEILDLLFKPDFGASLHILKVEIGGDGQSSEGTESSHMHEAWDENYSRGYEWWLMTEAKKRNPAIKLAGLPWSFPGWLGDGQWWPYLHPNRTADYIIRWIMGAQKHYGLQIDYIGIWNEKPITSTYVKTLRHQLDARGLKKVQIVAADHIGNAWAFVKEVQQDPELKAAISILGGHYTGTYSSEAAKESGLPIWSSEDYSVNFDLRGAGCMARLLNQNYVNGLMTSTIVWNMLVSYYDKLPYFPDGLMLANEPWSGHYELKGPIWTTAHTSQFTEPGWRYLAHGHGVGLLQAGGSYVTLVSPDDKHITVVIETMDTQHRDYCVRPPQAPQPVLPQNMTLHLSGSYGNKTELHLWHTQLRDSDENSSFFNYMGAVKVVEGQMTLALSVDSVYTLTSLTTGHKGVTSTPPPSQPFPLPYKDNFDSYPEHSEVALLAQQVGVFEVHHPSNCSPDLSGCHGDKTRGMVVRQVMVSAPIHWCPFAQRQPITVLGNSSWSDVTVTLDVWVGKENSTDSVFVGTRISNGGCITFLAQGVFCYISLAQQVFQLCHDMECSVITASMSVSAAYNTWHTLTLTTKGAQVTVMLNGHTLFNQTAPHLPNTAGFVGFGTGTFGLAEFDNLVLLPA